MVAIRCLGVLVLAGSFGCGASQQEPASGTNAPQAASAATMSATDARRTPAPYSAVVHGDDPKKCLNLAEAAESAWVEGVERKLDEKLASLGRCASAGQIKQEGRFYLSANFSPTGAWERLSSAMTTLPDCGVMACIEKELSAVQVEPWSGKPDPNPSFDFFLSPSSPPRHPAKGDAPFPFKDAKRCTEDSKPGAAKGRLPPEEIQKVVRSNYSEFRGCYEEGLGRNPGLRGQVSVRFVIERDGSVTQVSMVFLTLPDCKVANCVKAAYPKLKFPTPEGGTITVVYPIILEPG